MTILQPVLRLTTWLRAIWYGVFFITAGMTGERIYYVQ